MAHQIFNLPPQKPLSSSARILPGGKLHFYLTTTSTPADVYTTSALNVAHTQPVEADLAGLFPTIYLDPTVVYKATLSDANDVLLYTVDPVNDQVLSQSTIGAFLYPKSSAENSAAVTPVAYGREYAYVERYGTNTTPGTTDMTTALANAASVSAQGGGDAVVTSNILVSSNTTLPFGATLRFEQGGKITVANGVTLTIRSNINAGRAHIFSLIGTGSVVYDSFLNDRMAVSYPEWFGAVHDNSTDDQAAIQYAINMVAPAYGAVSLSTGYYRVKSTLTGADRVRIYGVTSTESVIAFAPDSNDDSFFQDPGGGSSVCEFHHFSVVGAGVSTGKRGFTISSNANDYSWHHMTIDGLNDWAIAADSIQRSSIKECRFGNIHNSTDSGTAILTNTFANRLSIDGNCRFYNNDRDISINGSGTSIRIVGNAFELTGALATTGSHSMVLSNVNGFQIDNNYIEGVKTATDKGVIRLETCVGGSVDCNYMSGLDGATTRSDSFVQFVDSSRNCRVNNNYFIELGITSGLQQFIIAGGFVVEAHGNHYIDGGTTLATYQDVVARLGNPANIDLDLPYTFTYNPGSLADAAGETHSENITGASFGDTYTVAAPYDLEDVTVSPPYTQASGVVEFRVQNESGGVRDLGSGTWKIFRKAGNL